MPCLYNRFVLTWELAYHGVGLFSLCLALPVADDIYFFMLPFSSVNVSLAAGQMWAQRGHLLALYMHENAHTHMGVCAPHTNTQPALSPMPVFPCSEIGSDCGEGLTTCQSDAATHTHTHTQP